MSLQIELTDQGITIRDFGTHIEISRGKEKITFVDHSAGHYEATAFRRLINMYIGAKDKDGWRK